MISIFYVCIDGPRDVFGSIDIIVLAWAQADMVALDPITEIVLMYFVVVVDYGISPPTACRSKFRAMSLCWLASL
jgi:hypothetical protein